MLWCFPVVIVQFYLYAIAGKFPTWVMPKHRNAPQPSMVAGLTQGRAIITRKEEFSRSVFFKRPIVSGPVLLPLTTHTYGRAQNTR